MVKRCDDKIRKFHLYKDQLYWSGSDSFILTHNVVEFITSVVCTIDGIDTKCNYKILDPNRIQIFLKRSSFKTITVTIAYEARFKSFKIYTMPPSGIYTLNVECGPNTTVNLMTEDNQIITYLNYQIINDGIDIYIPTGLKPPLTIFVINNKTYNELWNGHDDFHKP